MSDSTLHKKTGEVKPETQFKAENIGKWASKQENPFAEQNRKIEAKKRREAEQSKKATPVVAIILGVAATLAAVVGLVILVVFLINSQPKPDVVEIAGSTTEDITNYRNTLMEFYNQDPYAAPEERVQNIQEIVNGTLGSESGKNNADAVLYAQLYVYMSEGLYQEVVSVGNKINVDNLDNELKLNVYEALANSYSALGDQEKAKTYYQMLIGTLITEE